MQHIIVVQVDQDNADPQTVYIAMDSLQSVVQYVRDAQRSLCGKRWVADVYHGTRSVPDVSQPPHISVVEGEVTVGRELFV